MRSTSTRTRSDSPPPAARSGARLDRTSYPRHDLIHKYRELCAKYEALVKRHAESAPARAGATLALAALRASPSAQALTDRGHILYRNERWHELDRRSVEWEAVNLAGERAGKRYNNLRELAVAEAKEVLRPGAEPIRVERFEGPHGREMIEVRLERTRDKRVAVIVHDITERVRAERELERTRQAMFEQERLRSVGELASGVAHDLNNALHAMSMRLGLLKQSQAVMAEQGANIEAISRIADDAAARVGRLQEFARQRQDVPLESVDLGEVIRTAAEIAQPELTQKPRPGKKEIALALDVAALPRVVGAAAELRHVFVNLLLNARDAMADGGMIHIRCAARGDWVVATVCDEGTGIAEENLSRVFDPFFTTKGRRGTGLGLSIAYGVMRRLGGFISAGNRPEGGAVFTLSFPVSLRQEEDAGPAAPAAPAPGHRVLVVDDDADNLEATRFVLEALGEEVATASSGEDAVALFASGARYDLVLCDVGMPEMNGWEVAEEIRQLAPGTPVHMLTGWAHEIAPDDPRRQLVSGVLAKPLDIATLEQLLSRDPPLKRAPPRETASS